MQSTKPMQKQQQRKVNPFIHATVARLPSISDSNTQAAA